MTPAKAGGNPPSNSRPSAECAALFRPSNSTGMWSSRCCRPSVSIIRRSPSARRSLPGGARLAVWVIVNVEEWDPKRDDAAHRADAAGRRLADAGHPELGMARIRQPGRLLANARCVRRSAHPRRAGDQRLGDRGVRADRACRARARTGSSSATASARRTCRRSPTSATTSAGPARRSEATGKTPRGWLGPGLTETWDTPDLLAEEGYEYVCDWVLDDQPVVLKTRGKPIVNMPYTQECNDVAMMLIQHHTASEYRDRAIDQFEQLTPS